MSNVKKLFPGRDLLKCSFCGRPFTTDRITVHESICQKTSGLLRKSSDVAQERVRRAEVENFAKTIVKNESSYRLENNSSRGLLTNWRGKHEELIKKIKDAKEVANDKHSKVNDLPFPPPNDYDNDYVQCQYCSRKFNSVSAARHITTCANRMCISETKPNFADNSNPTAFQISPSEN